MRHFAIIAANFSISALVLQKQHRLNIRDDFLKWTNTKSDQNHFTHKFSATTCL